MIRFTLMDGSKMEFPREEVRAMLPLQPILQTNCLKEPVSGILYYRGEIFPVIGPVDMSETADTWILLALDHARMIHGIPEFPEDKATLNLVPDEVLDSSIEEQIAKELEELEKIA